MKKQEKDCVGKVRTSYRTDESPLIELNRVCWTCDSHRSLIMLLLLLKSGFFRSLAFRPSVFPYRVRFEVI